MGYTTAFMGQITVEPPLNKKEIAFLQKFSKTRRMNRTKGPYYVEGTGDFGQNQDADVIEHNTPPEGQPGLWCGWIPSEDGKYIEWDGGEKFYESEAWMAYIIRHFIGSDPIAKPKLKFLQGHVCNGEIEAQGEDRGDHWMLIVKDNKVSVAEGSLQYGSPRQI
jgi:hypothetical protein